MIKNVSRMIFKINEKECVLYCDQDLNTTELKEVGCQLIKFMGQIEDHSKQTEAKSDLSVIEETKPQE